MGGEERKPNVLIVDDDSGARAWVWQLELNGMDASLSDSPVDALRIIEKGGIDVVVSDIIFRTAQPEDLEAFVRRCQELKIGLIISTGADWDEIPKMPQGIRILTKPNYPDEYVDAVLNCHKENLAGGETGKIKVLVVDDDEYLAKEMPEGLMNFSSDFWAKGCTDLTKARAMLADERFDVVVSDIYLAGSAPEDVERFLKDAVGQGIGIMICSGAAWRDPPIIEGLVYVKKPASYNEYLGSIRKAARYQKPSRISDEAIHRLANPERHIETPAMKWEKAILESNSAARLHDLYLDYIRRDIMKASRRGDSKREQNDLMDKLARAERK